MAKKETNNMVFVASDTVAGTVIVNAHVLVRHKCGKYFIRECIAKTAGSNNRYYKKGDPYPDMLPWRELTEGKVIINYGEIDVKLSTHWVAFKAAPGRHACVPKKVVDAALGAKAKASEKPVTVVAADERFNTEALDAFAAAYGRAWRAELHYYWAMGTELARLVSADHRADLQAIRNTPGGLKFVYNYKPKKLQPK